MWRCSLEVGCCAEVSVVWSGGAGGGGVGGGGGGGGGRLAKF